MASEFTQPTPRALAPFGRALHQPELAGGDVVESDFLTFPWPRLLVGTTGQYHHNRSVARECCLEVLLRTERFEAVDVELAKAPVPSLACHLLRRSLSRERESSPRAM